MFAIPGPITSNLSKAPLKLIEKGAVLVVDADNILKEFKIQNPLAKPDLASREKIQNLSKDELKVLEILENEALHFDEIGRNLRLNASKTASILSIMEMK